MPSHATLCAALRLASTLGGINVGAAGQDRNSVTLGNGLLLQEGPHKSLLFATLEPKGHT